jgi:hypothetical protein
MFFYVALYIGVVLLILYNYPPIITVVQPSTIDPPCAVESPILAAGLPPISTVDDPMIILSGGPTHIAISPRTAAGMPPIKTVEQPGPEIIPPTCGIGGVPGVCMGHEWKSVILAAAGISLIFISLSLLPHL